MFEQTSSIVAIVLLCAVVVAAVWKGGPSEQGGAAIAVVAWVSSAVLQSVVSSYAWPLLVVDLLALAAFGVLTWRSSRDWPVIATAFQAVSAAVSVLFVLDVTIQPVIYVLALAVATFGVLGSIAYGVFTRATRPPQAGPIS